jgi:Peptidase A4 family
MSRSNVFGEAITGTPEAPLPPEGFDPVRNPKDVDRLAEFWLPERPDHKKQPDLYAHWHEMFSPLPTFVKARSLPRHKPHVSNMPNVPPRLRAGAGLLESSRNWSGAYLDCTNANPFRRVVGAWTIPAVNPGIRQKDDLDLPFQCSAWIGIDGKKQWTESMPQVGTEHGIGSGGRRHHFLWWQWWQRRPGRDPELPFIIRGVPVKPGDRVLCSLTLVTPERVRIHVVNRKTNLFATVEVTADEPVRGGTAEWVVERQSDFRRGPDVLHPLPDFTEVTFDHCAVEGLDAAVPPQHWVPRYIQLTQIMRNPDEQARLAIISRPAVQEEARTVKVVYQSPKAS